MFAPSVTLRVPPPPFALRARVRSDWLLSPGCQQPHWRSGPPSPTFRAMARAPSRRFRCVAACSCTTTRRRRCGRRTGRRGRRRCEGGGRFRLVSDYAAGRRPAGGDRASWPPASIARERDQVLLGVTGSRQDLHHGAGSSRRPSARRWSWRTTRPWPRSSTASSSPSSRTTRSSTSSATTTTTSPRPTSRAPTPTSRRTRRINEQIDRMRHSATRAILERDDVIVVASVQLHLRHRLGGDLLGHDLHPEGRRRRSTRSS